MTWTSCLLVMLLIVGELGGEKVHAAQGDGMSVEHVSSLGLYGYARDTLSKFEATGRLEPNPGIDGADIEAFISLLESSLSMFDAIKAGECERFERMSLVTKKNIEREFGTRVAEAILLASQELSYPRCE